MLENIGLIIKAYNPAPDIAGKIAMIPPMHWTNKLLYAINLNSLSLNNSAFGTMLAEAKNKLKDNKWHMDSNELCL